LAEPIHWLLTASDATASLQWPGSTGFMTFLWSTAGNAPATVRFDDHSVISTGDPLDASFELKGH